MWFIGALAGGVLGAAAFGFGGFVLGALLGGVVGGFIGFGNAMNTKSRLEVLEGKVAALEAAMGGAPGPVVSQPVRQPEPQPVRQPEVIKVPLPEPQPEPQPEPAREPVFVREEPEPQPAGPDFWERLVGGNVVAKVGILVLFVGVSFLVKYFYERIHIPIELRLTAVALGALVVLAFGWRLRESRPGYALILQGGGIAVLYLVIFSAFRLFGVLPGPLAFVLLVGVAAASVALAIAQNSLTLAVIAVSGGFLAPILASTGRGSHVMLFSYYAVLNAGIFVIAWVKAWRVLNILGFAFTFGIGTLWGANNYRPEMLASTEPFLALFFAMYLAIPILFARKRAVELKDYVDGTLVFGTPVVAFGLQAAAVRHIEYAAAYSAFFLAVVYLALAAALFRRAGQGLRLLVESYIALGVAFATLAIPLAFEGRLTSAAWALEGAAVVWIGVRQGRLLARAFGYLLQLAAGIAFLTDVAEGYGPTPVLNSFAMGCLFLAAAAFFCSAYLERNWQRLRADAEAFNAKARKNSSSLRRGVGVGCMWYGIGNTALANPSTLRIVLSPQGRLVFYNGAVDIGQGSNTTLTQVAADALGLPMAQFELVMGDTDRTADAGKTSASRQAFISGKAAELAGFDLRRMIFAAAGAPPGEFLNRGYRLQLQRGSVVFRKGGITHRWRIDRELVGEGRFDPPTQALDANGQGMPYATYAFAAQVALVEVDEALGTVKVLHLVAAHDVGKALNPIQVEGQIQGGAVQGLGLALMEEYVPGKTENLHDYLIPTIGDVPHMDCILVEDPEPLGPSGAKGVGEPGLIPTAPAILGAIDHATGVRMRQVPVLPHRLKAELDARPGRRA